MSDNETVLIDFQPRGIREIQSAFQSVEQAMLRVERTAAASSRREAQVRISEARKMSQSRLREENALLADVTKVERAKLAETLRAERAKLKATEMSAAARSKAYRGLLEESGRMERQLTSLVRGEIAAREAAEKASHERRKQFGKMVAGTVTSSAGRTLGTIASYGGMAMSLGGSLALGTAVQRGMSAESQSISLANSMFNPNDPDQKAWLAANGKNGRFDAKKLNGFAGAVQAKSGIDKGELLSGFQSYIAKSSDWTAMSSDGGQQTLTDLANLAKATDTSFADVMSTAGNLKAQNQALKPEQMMQMMYAMVGQGKMGNIEMNDVAKHGSTITSSASKYAGSQSEAQRRLLALVQVTGRAAGSPADAATGVARFGGDVAKKAKHNEEAFKAQGFKVTDGKGQLLAPSEIISQYFKVTKGDTTKMGEGKGNLGLGMESIKVAMGSAGVYSGAVSEARLGNVSDPIRSSLKLGNKKTFTEDELNTIGAEAVRHDVAKLEGAGYKKSDIQDDLAIKMASTQERYQKVTRELTEKLEARFLPLVEKLAGSFEKHAPQLDRFIDGIGRLADYMLENPYKGVGAVIAASVAKDVAAAGIGKAVNGAMSAALGSSAGITIAAATIAIAAGMIAIDAIAKGEADAHSKDIATSTSAYAEAKALERDAIEGKMTPAKQRRIYELQQQMGQQLQDDKANQYERSGFEQVASFLNPGDDADTQAEYQKARDEKVKQSAQAFDELTKAMAMATKSMKSIAKDAGGHAPTSPAAPARNVPLGPRK